ncbi:hypothetical protein A6R68_17388, partial [Neotoma lepida]
DTAVREVFEETGVKSEFRSLLSIRQQHGSPGAFGKSDMYLVCRLQPCSFTINFCQQECLKFSKVNQLLADIGRNSMAFCPGPVLDPSLYCPVRFSATYQLEYFRDRYVNKNAADNEHHQPEKSEVQIRSCKEPTGSWETSETFIITAQKSEMKAAETDPLRLESSQQKMYCNVQLPALWVRGKKKSDRYRNA